MYEYLKNHPFNTGSTRVCSYNEELKGLHQGTLICFGISRKDIERGHLQKYLQIIDQLDKKKGSFAGKVIFQFDSFDFDPRELHQIPEVRNWVKRLVKNKPHIFYYLCDFSETLLLCFLCLTDTKVVKVNGGQTLCNVELNPTLIGKVINSAKAHAKKRGDNEEETVNRILVAIKGSN